MILMNAHQMMRRKIGVKIPALRTIHNSILLAHLSERIMTGAAAFVTILGQELLVLHTSSPLKETLK